MRIRTPLRVNTKMRQTEYGGWFFVLSTSPMLNCTSLMSMPEIEREVILATRMDEIQKFQDKRNLEALYRAQRGDSENVAKAAKSMPIPFGIFFTLSFFG